MTEPLKSVLSRLDELSAKATKGVPWKVQFPYIQATNDRKTIIAEVTGAFSNPVAQADAALIVALRNAWPSVSRLLKAQAEALEKCERAFDLLKQQSQHYWHEHRSLDPMTVVRARNEASEHVRTALALWEAEGET